MIGAMSLVLAALGAGGLLLFGDRLDPIRAECMWLALILVPLVSLGALRGAMLRGLRKVVLGQMPEQVIRPTALLLMILVLYVAGHEFGTAASVMAVQVLSVAVAFAFGLYFFMRHRPAELATAVPQYKSSTAWLYSSIPFGLSAAMQLINGRTDILVLGIFRDDAEVGVYRVAVQLATLIVFAQQTVNAIQGPYVAHLYAEGDKKKLQKMVTKSSRAIFSFSLFIVVALAVFGEPLIRVAFGPHYIGAYWPLLILSIGQLVNASTGAVANVLNMTGHERDTMLIILVGAILNVTLNFSLTPLLGMTGAAIGTASGLVTWNVLMWHRAYKRTGIDTSPLVRRKPRG
jgi:O-antigen/teichoic acid export membrane protein